MTGRYSFNDPHQLQAANYELLELSDALNVAVNQLIELDQQAAVADYKRLVPLLRGIQVRLAEAIERTHPAER